MKSEQSNNKSLVNLVFSTKAITGKLLIIMSPIYYYLQTKISLEWWEKLANISIAVFVLMIGIYILYRENQKQDQYVKEQHDKMIEMAERTSQLAESSVRAIENSTQAIRNMTESMERIFNRLDNLN